jgi:flavin-dependent dehydrogenase
MKSSPADVAVVGAGLAGSTAAALLARAGFGVHLIEPDRFPREKLCGEFLSFESVAVLERSGAWPAIRAWNPPPLADATFTTPSGRTTDLRLPEAGWGVGRRRLDAHLFEHAIACGATPVRGRVEGWKRRPDGGYEIDLRTPRGLRTLSASRALGAFGRNAGLRPRKSSSPRGRWVGVKRHHRATGPLPDLDGRVEIHVFDGGYCGINRVDGDAINVCALIRSEWVKARGVSKERWFEAMARRNPVLAERMDRLTADPDAPISTVSGIDFARLEPVQDGVPLLGDAAAMIAPLAGDGQGMALTAAASFVGSVVESGWDRAVTEWSTDFRRKYRPRLGLGRALQATLLHPWGCEALVGVCRAFPALGDSLARHTREPTQTWARPAPR